MGKKRGIIIGGGSSINDGIELGLSNKIKNEFVIGINYAHRFFDVDLVVFLDKDLWKVEKEEILKKKILVAGKKDGGFLQEFLNLKAVMKETETMFPLRTQTISPEKPFGEGIFYRGLSGVFGTAFLCQLDFDEIYLLGMDFGGVKEKSKTHFYQDKLQHRGTGVANGKYKTRVYNKEADDFFNKFDKFKKKIFNVSPLSRIKNFEKINYETMFSKLENREEFISKEETREFVKENLIKMKKEVLKIK